MKKIDKEYIMKTFWNKDHELSELGSKLEELIPFQGKVEKYWKYPKLERFRKMVNAYYDIMNNGGGNRMRSISKFFGTDVTSELNSLYSRDSYFRNKSWERIHSVTEPVLEQAVLEAAEEQGIQL